MRALLKNISYNMAAGIFPAIASLAIIPIIIRKNGFEFFGIFSISIYILSLISIMDFGATRAMALFKYTSNKKELLPETELIKLPLQMCAMIAMGTIISAVPLIVMAKCALYISLDTAYSLFFIVLSGALSVFSLPFRTISELRGDFIGVSIVRGLSAAFIPVSVLLPNIINLSDLQSSTFYILISRLVTLYYYAKIAHVKINKKMIKGILAYDPINLKLFYDRAKLVGLTNVLSLIVAYQDRFILALLLGPLHIARYATAYELSSKIWLANGALTVAVTPTVGAEFRSNSQTESLSELKHLNQWKLLTVLFVIAPTLFVIIVCDPLLKIWLGSAYAAEITSITQILCFGMAINCASQTNFSLLQLAGFEDRALGLQVINIIASILIGAGLVTLFGAIGAACAMSSRLILDGYMCRYFLTRALSDELGFTLTQFSLITAISFVVLYLSLS